MTDLQYALDVKNKSCDRKIWYRSRARARKHLGPSTSKTSCVGDLHVYKCLFCDGWHLGSKISAARQNDIEWAARILREAA